jgi:methionyl-tRNA formyltransferase
MKDVRIVFMGTPEIAVESLQRIIQHNYTVAAVVTSVDKPAGRGLKVHESAVKQCALQYGIPILQPENLSDADFIGKLKDISPDLIIVVAFRKIPDEVLSIAKLGSFNLHASLLPQYRGAAPINWVIINGETLTGMTTFLLNSKIDAGDILLKRNIEIPPDWNASDLHDRMKTVGADMVIDTIEILIKGHIRPLSQDNLTSDPSSLKKAPKIFREHCHIDWNLPVLQIHNLIRGLSRRPGAYTELISPEGIVHSMKILASEYSLIFEKHQIGEIETDNKNYLRIYCSDGYIGIKELQLSGKKLMSVEELLRGFKLNNLWHIG